MRKITPMSIISKRHCGRAAALSLGLVLSGCGAGTLADNQSLYSVNQPVVERTNYTLDVPSNSGGLAIGQQQRIADWFEAMDLRYGDRLTIDDPMASGATREAVGQLAARYGILLSDGAPVTSGFVAPGNSRIVLTRSTASVPSCPNWSIKSETNYANGTRPNYGCGVNGNLAAMVANPEDLINGQRGTGETVVATSTKAIDAYRQQAPTGEGGLPQTASDE